MVGREAILTALIVMVKLYSMGNFINQKRQRGLVIAQLTSFLTVALWQVNILLWKITIFHK
jgi:hypothetical protein